MKEIYRMAAEASQYVYEHNTTLGTVEYNNFFKSDGGVLIQVLAIAGTNELGDWWANVNLSSWKGIKYGAWKAAKQIHEEFVPQRDPARKLLVTGHSKAGATAIAYKKLFGADYCVAFAPARSLRYWCDRKMNNTTIFIDPDDPVSKAGFVSFGHPKCEVIKAEDDHIGLSIGDHFMHNWVNFVEATYGPETDSPEY